MRTPTPRNVVMLVSTDPVLTARIIKLANSAMFATRHGVHSLADAVNLLGFTQLRALVTAAALASSFKAVPGVNLEQFWRYSLNTALVCKTLARNFGVNEGAAFTAGLVHAVGELILHLGAQYSMGMLSSIQFTDLSRRRHENEILGYNFINVSAAFVKNWDFPEVISQAIDAWCNPLSGDAPNLLAAILTIASWRAQILENNSLSEDAMKSSFPAEAAAVLKLDPESVFEKDPSEWTSSNQVALFTL